MLRILEDFDIQDWWVCLISSAHVRTWDIQHVPRPNKGRFWNKSEIDTLISKRLSGKNKAKLSQLEIINKQYYR